MNTFEEYIDMFNKAIESENSDDAIRLGRKIVEIADRECKRPGITSSIKKIYTDNSQRAREYIADLRMMYTADKKPSNEVKSEQRKWFSSEVPSLNLRDVKGLQHVKDEFVINILAPFSQKYAPIYRKFRGAEFGSQILLYGPPGTGKTFLVKCLAGHIGCNISIVQTKDILANLVGDAEKNMGEVFEEARNYDRCIIFFDEFDALAASRDDEESRHTRGVLTTLLTYMDGFLKDVKEGQHRIVIAATNRPWILDSAVKRGGRFDTQIYVPIPDYDARYQLIRLALGKDDAIKNRVDVPCSEDVSIEWLAEKFDGMSGADINAVCKQIINRPMHREIKSLQAGEGNADEAILREDCEVVIGKYINGITDEMRVRFEAYSSGLEFNEYLKIMADKARGNHESIPDYVLRYIKAQ